MSNAKIIFLLLMLAFTARMSLAQGVITGKVADEWGEPVAGAAIAVKGTTIGTLSGADGSFSINLPQGSMGDTIQISYMGMQPVEMAIGGRAVICAVLSAADYSIGEVEVTALGISKPHRAIGYSALQASGSDILKTRASNPMMALAGKAPGVDIMGNAGPGSTVSVMIRGAASLKQNQPLYIVDGVPLVNSQKRAGSSLNFNTDMGSGINAINPADIESVTVLKGCAATALYGSRATNGVVIITSKSGAGQGGKMSFQYDGTLSLQRAGMLPKEQEMFGQGWDGSVSREENGSWGPAYNNQNQVWGYVVDGKQRMASYSFLESRLRDFYETGLCTSHTISASGGDSQSAFYASAGHDSQNGIIPGSHDTYSRTSISTRASRKWNRLELKSGISLSIEKTKAIPSGQGESLGKQLWNSPNNISLLDLKDLDSPFNSNGNYFCLFGYNPYFLIDNFNAEMRKSKTRGNIEANVEIFSNLKFTYRLGGDVENSKTEQRRNVIRYDEGSPHWNYNVNMSGGNGTAYPGYYDVEKRTEYEINHDAFFTYKASLLGGDLGLSAIAGINVMETSLNYSASSVSDLVVADYYSLSNSTAEPSSSFYQQKIRRAGLLANADIDYMQRLYFTFTCRNDWSSTLPAASRSYAYPGATLSWVFADKGSGDHCGPLTFGKLRASYGWTGKDAEAFYVYDTYAKTEVYNYEYPSVGSLQFPIGGVSSWSLSNRMGNQGLKPELTSELELGTELIFLGGRLSLDADYYNKFTKNLISNQKLDWSMGYTEYLANIGDVRNQGVEVMFSAVPIKNASWAWSIALNYAKNCNKVERLALEEINLAGFSGAGIYAVEGQPLGQFKVCLSEKVVHDGSEYTVVNAMGYPVISDEQYIGKNVNEKFRAGLSSRLDYKGLSLEATLDLHYGGYFFCNTKGFMGWSGSGYETTLNNRNPFIIPGSVTPCEKGAEGSFEVDGQSYVENTVAIASCNSNWAYFYGDVYGFNGSDELVLSRSYLKLRNISLSYTIPKSAASKLRLQEIRLSVNAANILLWTPAENCYVDPECTTFGTGLEAKFGEFLTNPTNRLYTFGLTVKF